MCAQERRLVVLWRERTNAFTQQNTADCDLPTLRCEPGEGGVSAVLTAASQHLGPTLVLGCREEMPQKGGLSEGGAFSWIKAGVASRTTKML